ncbi:MAG: hypothetical protein GX610_23505 [Rhodococcus sp.]|nr:hypothetical protein [Rhodococcus sp. (in: high G+C Gram-positive bacteria)]
MLPPERRTRVDLIVAAAIVVVLIVAATIVWLFSDARGTTSVTAEQAPDPVASVSAPPETLAQAWDAPSAATTTPVTAADSVVVTADGGAVVGRDRRSGDELWRYERDLELCGVVGAWDDVVAVYRDDRGCSQATKLRGGTGVRDVARNSDADPNVTVTDEGTYVSSRGDRRMELWRSDLVRTLEYGRVDAQVNPKSQPRSGCRLLDSGASDSRAAVLESCPGEQAARLTILDPAPDDGREPDEFNSSVLAELDLDAEGARIIAVSGDNTAVYLPAGSTAGDRIGIYGGDGEQLSVYPLPRPVGPDVLAATTGPNDSKHSTISWWTGTEVLKLDPRSLQPQWAFVGTLGPGAAMGNNLLVPVKSGIAVLDLASGRPQRVIEFDRGDYEGPITTTVLGGVILEQRGDTVVALRSHTD